MHYRSGGDRSGRDGCRVPLPWSGDRRRSASAPTTSHLAAAAGGLERTSRSRRSEADPHSTLHLYREALRLRRELPELGDGAARWWDRRLGGEVLAFRRGDDFACVVNTGDDPIALPRTTRRPALERPARRNGVLPGNSAAWLRTDAPDGATTPTTHTPRS